VSPAFLFPRGAPRPPRRRGGRQCRAMGGKRKRGGGGKGKGKGRDGGDANAAENAGGEEGRVGKRAKAEMQDYWKEEPGSYTQENAGFEAFYKRQGVCPETEWSALLESLRSGLPAAIRINGMRLGARALKERLAEMSRVCSVDPEREVYAPGQLQWYQHGLAWHWKALERKTIKKDARHMKLKDYLAERERRGLITRQEVVSMLPPLFLEVEPHHLVLDMCAAPGSKTTQILEMMHWANAAEKKPPPSGLVMANELQWKRANMLAHQVGRLGSPAAAVTNMDAHFFPDLWVDGEPFQFDRILCDVPCTGDGTMRKTPYIWKSWTYRDALAIHIRQLGILFRGLELLKVGGRLVYSTCSLNPLEDEAVVAAALLRHGDSIALCPRPASLEGVRAATCLERWVVPSPADPNVFFESYEDVPKEHRMGKLRLLPSMFPPVAGEANDAIRASVRDHCCRLLPHLMDTGGFFVAAFEKRAPLKLSAKAKRMAKHSASVGAPGAPGPAEAADEPVTADGGAAGGEVASEVVDALEEADDGAAGPAPVASSDAAAAGEALKVDGDAVAAEATGPASGEKRSAPGPQAPQKLRRITKDYTEVGEALEDEWEEVKSFYGFDTSLSKRLFARGNVQRQIYLQSEGAQRLLRSECRLPTRMVLSGVLALSRSGNCHVRACQWQLEQEGIAALCQLSLRRRLSLRGPLLKRLLTEREISLVEVRAAAAAGHVRGLDAVADPTGAAGDLVPGSVALELLLDEGSSELPPVFAVAARISDEALEIAASNVEAASLLEDLSGQPSVDDILGAAAPLPAAAEDKKADEAECDAECDAGGDADGDAPAVKAAGEDATT